VEKDWFSWAKEQTDPLSSRSKPEALEGLTVIDASFEHMGGLVCSSVLAEFGAEVIRVEPPGGDPARKYTPDGILIHDTGLGYLVEGHNKWHVTLDLRSEEGRKIFKQLSSHADVIIETYPAGLMDAWGIGYRQLSKDNPGLVYLAIYNYGQFGPRAKCGLPDAEIVSQAASGIVYITGEPDEMAPPEFAIPTKVGNWLGWYTAGLFGAFGVLLALNHRHKSGKGQMVDVSGIEAIMGLIDYNIVWYHTQGEIKQRIGNYDTAVFPYTFARCQDGYVFIAAYNDQAFSTLAEVMDRLDLLEDPRFNSFAQRTKLENERALLEIIEQWTSQFTAEEIIQKVQQCISKKKGPAAAVVTGRVNNARETMAQQNWWERGVLAKIHDTNYGELVLQMPPWKMAGAPPRFKWPCRPVGADNEYIYGKYLGYGSLKINKLKEAGII
jgi:crotonobetainyl-CoA:carnitine CoA-transferase CaiB-like acyl-CoA transferase